ncbi:MAG: excinuclease ABC subunit UvrC [Alphaproteobacteria bacterium]|nr:excinuclease ABC subunit UvrC [Alphaproteobacteria bacterium]
MNDENIEVLNKNLEILEGNSLPIIENLSGADYVSFILKYIPSLPGVYRMISKNNEILYVGKAKNLRNRLESYSRPETKTRRIQKMISLIHHIEIVETKTEAEAFLLENDLIKKLKPHFNILLRDDKTYPYLLLSIDEEWPQLIKYRGNKRDGGKFFGPYSSGDALNETLVALQKAFLLRSCSNNVFKNRTRACLLYQIKRCCGPCVGNIDKINYNSLVSDVADFMQGKSIAIQKKLENKMNLASENLNYEEAAVYRDRIRALNKIQQQSKDLDGVDNADVIVAVVEYNLAAVQMLFYRDGRGCGSSIFFPIQTEEQTPSEILAAFIGQFYQKHNVPKEIIINEQLEDKELIETVLHTKITDKCKSSKKRILERAILNANDALKQKKREIAEKNSIFDDFQNLLNLENIQRIEIYDNSHIQGTNAVGAMVVATRDGLDRKSYRKYNIIGENYTPGDDFAMMHEVLTRRFKRGLKENLLPDVVLIDGGEQQLKEALLVLEELSINNVIAVGVAKGVDRNAGKETLYFKDRAPLNLDFDNPVLHFIQRLRDEAHRFVITTHRNKRNKSTLISSLDDIKGIGDKRKKALLEHFGSAVALRSVSAEEISKIPGISLDLAKEILLRLVKR